MNLALPVTLATILLSAPTFADQSAAGLQAFTETCIPYTKQFDPRILETLTPYSPDTIKVLQENGLGNFEGTQQWETKAPNFFIVTHEDYPVCYVLGLGVKFDKFQSAYNDWVEGLNEFYGTDQDFDLGRFGRAGVFMAQKVNEHEALQLTINHIPDIAQGFVTMVAVRPPQISPAAQELFDKYDHSKPR